MRGVPLVLCLAFLLAGCGGDDSSTSSASEDYANSVCSDLSTWITDVQATTKSLTDAALSISEDDVENAVNEIEKDTSTLADELKQEGAPDTEDGQQAKTDLENLTNELQTQVDDVKQAADSSSGTAALVSAVLGAVSNGANALKSTYESLQGLDPAGELKDAFENSDDCKSLKDQVDEIGSGS
jgi:methyl-accepting chemotaxis protein